MKRLVGADLGVDPDKEADTQVRPSRLYRWLRWILLLWIGYEISPVRRRLQLLQRLL